jgi:hypothetical protein
MAKIINKLQFKELMKDYPDGGIVFSEYAPDVFRDIEVTDGDFGATMIAPIHGETFDYDFNINEYKDTDLFIIFDNEDVLHMISILTTALKFNLKDDDIYNASAFGF